ncbi:MAG: hypothetical protein HZB53_15030 [Chloroflexi bacterium]|nr:hypothetical protein [Chloroflexota bacterium]
MTLNTRRYLSSHILTERPRVISAAEFRPNWRNWTRWALTIAFLAIAVMLTVLESSVSTETSQQIDILRQKIDQAQSANLQLTVDIAEMEKPARIRDRAYALGFTELSKSIKLAVPAVAADPAPESMSQPARDERSLGRRLFDGLVQRLKTARR